MPLVRLGATAFVSAFLLFQVQPLIAKAVLPWFGGTPAVWTTCMLFFQLLLLGGYALSALFERLRPLPRLLSPWLLLLPAVASLPLTPAAHFRGAGDQPVFELLRLLLLSVGVPYLLLATTGPLSGAWFRRAAPDRSPYRLYALSNVGSLLSLLTYPVAIEPWLTLRWQSRLWSVGFVIFAVLYASSLIQDYRKGARTSTPAESGPAPVPPSPTDRLLWILLPTLSSMSLIAVTNHVCQNVAVIPFLWVVPLSLYLLSFIIAFDHERYYLRALFAAAALALLVLSAMSAAPGIKRVHLGFVWELLQHLSALFCVCMLCHGEVVRRKPHPKYLTTFYLYLSTGGAIGGLLVSLAAPRLFHSYFEWRIALWGGYLLAAAVLYATQRHRLRGRAFLAVPLAGLVLAGGYILVRPTQGTIRGHVLTAARNFYGVLTIVERSVDDPAEHDLAMFHGAISHGMQLLEGDRKREPAGYYGSDTGVGRTLEYYRGRGAARVAVVGLGAGTLAAYSRADQVFRFYEINPMVEKLARQYFTYLSAAPGKLDVVIGDGRLLLEQETEPPFHALVIDAFTGDAVPAHLLTREAMDIYLRRLRPDGALLIHISNRYLNLAPVVRGLAAYGGLNAVRVDTVERTEDRLATEWMILTNNPGLLAELAPAATPVENRQILWTDESNDLFRILR